MIYVKIDDNRFQTAYSEIINQFGIDGIKVDCIAPSKNYKLKEDYINYSNENQWEIDLLKKFQEDIQYQHDAFNEYSREIIYQIQYNIALGNTTLVADLKSQLQTEQAAVIARINEITTAYNGGST